MEANRKREPSGAITHINTVRPPVSSSVKDELYLEEKRCAVRRTLKESSVRVQLSAKCCPNGRTARQRHAGKSRQDGRATDHCAYPGRNQRAGGWRERRRGPPTPGYYRGFASLCQDPTSCSTSRVTMANSTLTDNPVISTPEILSTGPKFRHLWDRTTSP